jgi:hypothetical protein
LRRQEKKAGMSRGFGVMTRKGMKEETKKYI